jgi:hypothetical protein
MLRTIDQTSLYYSTGKLVRMKKRIISLTVALGTALFSSAMSATFTDAQVLNQYVASGGSYGGTFNLITPGNESFTVSGFPSGNGTYTDQGGYTPGTALTSLTVQFFLVDRLSLLPLDILCISLDGLDSLGVMLGTQATFTYNGGKGLLQLVQTDGMLNYHVQSLFGDFTIQDAVLSVTTDGSKSGGGGVADGGMTLALMGCGLVGLDLLRRKTVGHRAAKVN